MALNRAIIALRYLHFSPISYLASRKAATKTSFSNIVPKRLKRIRGAGNEEAQQQRQTVLGQGRLIHHIESNGKPACEV